MKSLLSLIFAIATVWLISACSSTSDKNVALNYRSSEITPTLEIPPDLTQLNSNENLNLPGSKVGLAENKGRYIETGNLNVELRTLPRVEGLRIEGEGDLHWLLVPEKAEKLYPMIRIFWSEQGFLLQKDEPSIGVMETEWLSVNAGDDSFLASLFNILSGADSKDQYKTRFERTANGEQTRIYLAHRGQEYFLVDPDKSLPGSLEKSGWQLQPADPAKEYEMLSRMMIFLGMQKESVREEMKKIGLFAARARIEYDEENEETYLLSSQGYQQTMNRLRHQLDRLSIENSLTDVDQYKGDLQVSSKAFFSPDHYPLEDATLYLSLETRATDGSTRIDIRDEDKTLLKGEMAKEVLHHLLGLLK